MSTIDKHARLSIPYPDWRNPAVERDHVGLALLLVEAGAAQTGKENDDVPRSVTPDELSGVIAEFAAESEFRD
jgi:hypothetical protein